MVKINLELSLFKENILLMGSRVYKMHEDALRALKNNDKDLALSIIESDEYVNNDEESVNRRALEVLALLAPVASDLRIIIAGIKIATDLERMGDYAKNIARFILKNEPVRDEQMILIEEIYRLYLDFLSKAMDAFDERNLDAAFALPKLDEEIDALIKNLFFKLEEIELNDPNTIRLIPLVGMARNIERAGDHTKNICEQIIYEATGQHYDFG
ncbi:MAG: phosphate signaling complex protein PhoU [Erysipelotrichaceae bacterium]|nr:phosphate signaling complex protein PhoU [Erysipelotrichaceae bacterium]